MTAQPFKRTPFASRLIRHAMRDRARRETGSPDPPAPPWFDDWRDGIHPWVRQSTSELVVRSGLRVHGHAAAVNSSMGFAFNLFMPLREYGREVLASLLGAELGTPVSVLDVAFEFHGPTDVLAECAGPSPVGDEKFTASDVAIRVTDGAGRRGIVLVEVKLSEGGFTTCGGATSSANPRTDLCASAAAFFREPGSCYLRRTRHARRDRRYWDILEAAFGSVREAVPGYAGDRCPFEGHEQQIMRNHALALGLVQAGEADFSAFGLAHHPDNHHVAEPWERYRAMVAPGASLFRLPADAIVDAAAALGGEWADWADYMRGRYMLTCGAGEAR
mgnify:CR=1 FL=1